MSITLKSSSLLLILVAIALVTAFIPAFVWPHVDPEMPGVEMWLASAFIGFFTFAIAMCMVGLLQAARVADACPFPERLVGPDSSVEIAPRATAGLEPKLAPEHPSSTQSKPTPEIPQHEISGPVTVISDHSLDQARMSLIFAEYKAQDDLRDPVDSLYDAEKLLHEARKINYVMTEPSLRHTVAKRLEWVLRNPSDPQTIAIAEVLVMHNRERCAKLGVLDPVTNLRRSV